MNPMTMPKNAVLTMLIPPKEKPDPELLAEVAT